MRAIILHEPGPPEALKIEDVPRPELLPGTAILRMGAFGLNRSALFTRRGQSPGVSFPCRRGSQRLATSTGTPAVSRWIWACAGASGLARSCGCRRTEMVASPLKARAEDGMKRRVEIEDHSP